MADESASTETPQEPGADPAGAAGAASVSTQEFRVKDCALVAIATGRRALTLRELRDAVAQTGLDCIYHHFWGGLLQPRFGETEYNNDFSAWARHGLHDDVLAERLAMLDPTDFSELDALRQELLEIVDERLDESDYLPWVRASEPFELMRSQIVVFDTGRRVSAAVDLARTLPSLSTSSIFYHFIDARRRLPESCDDFTLWLAGFGERYEPLQRRLAGIDPYFGTLHELRQQITAAFDAYFGQASP